MNIEQFRLHVEHYLGNAQIGEAIDTIIAFAQHHRLQGVRQNALLLRSQYFALKQKYEVRGMLHHQEYQVEVNRIAAGVLSLAQEGIVKDRQKQSIMRWFLPTALILLGGVAYWQWNDTPPIVAEAQPPVSVTLSDSTPTTSGDTSVSIVDTASGNTKASGTSDPPKPPTKKGSEPLTKRKPTTTSPKNIEITITIDTRCWEGSEVFVNGKGNGIMAGMMKKVQVPYREDGYEIYVRGKDGKKSSSEFYSPKNSDNTINITCKH